MNSKSWEKFRGDCLVYAKDREETVLKKWLNEIGYTEPIGYYRDISDKVMEIYTIRPGVLIGRAGVNVEKFEKILSDEFGGEWKVKFIEIRGGFVL